MVQQWATCHGLLGRADYSNVGAVVSPRDLASTERIRTSMPSCLFLVPGFGAQGRTSEEIAKCFKPDGTGAIVNACRHAPDELRITCGCRFRSLRSLH